MAFNLIQLETFRRLAIEANFTRTAEALNLTQPAVTQHVRALTDHFHVKLVDLVGRRTVLTDAGILLAKRAEHLLGNVAALERDMREFADLGSGELRLGATVTIGTYTLPALAARFRKSYPDITLHVDIANTDTMAEAVKAGRVSLALVEGPLDDPDLEIEPYADDELVLIVSPNHPLARRRKGIVAADLANVPFVLREEGSGTLAQVRNALRRVGIEPIVALTLPTGEGIVRAVELEVGVAMLSRLVVATALKEKRLVRVRVTDLVLERTFRLVRLRRLTASPATLAFTALARAKPTY